MQPVHQQQWTPSPEAPVPAGPRARTGLIVLTAFLVELVVIAAGCNQKVTDQARDFLVQPKHQADFLGQVVRAGQTYDWRLGSAAGAPGHLRLSQYLLLATLFVLTAACVYALARGAVTFGRVFVGTWLGVIVATEVAVFVQYLVVDDIERLQYGRLTYALFHGPTGYSFVAGLLLGLLVGLVAGLVAVATRRPAVAPAAPERYDEPSGNLAATSDPWSGPDRREDNFATTQFPAYVPPSAPPPAPAPPPAAAPPPPPAVAPPPPPPPAPTGHPSVPASDATTQIPRVPPPSDDDPNKTTMLPRPNFPKPPDDEDLGHHPE